MLGTRNYKLDRFCGFYHDGQGELNFLRSVEFLIINKIKYATSSLNTLRSPFKLGKTA